jgi:hypothetical protein
MHDEDTWVTALARQTQEHPGRTVAMAVAAGFVVGGGLVSPLTGRILSAGMRLGLRLVLLPFVTQTLIALTKETHP